MPSQPSALPCFHKEREKTANFFQPGQLLFLAFCFLFLTACASPTPAKPGQFELFIIGLDEQTLVNTETLASVPLPSMPACTLWDAYPAPRGAWVALEYDCPRGSLVSLLDATSGQSVTSVNETDSHFLGWEADGQALYLKTDVLGDAKIVRATPAGVKPTRLPATTYHISAAPDGRLLYALTPGVGLGSELWQAGSGWNAPRRILSEAGVISFATWSPDSQQIAYILMPDDMTPYPMGELWLADADGSNGRMLAPADSGHGYPPVWSPDNRLLAYIHRESADDAGALESNVYLADTASGEIRPLTKHAGARVWGIAWSPDGASIAYNLNENDTINVQIQPLAGGEPARVAVEGAICCAAWLEVR